MQIAKIISIAVLSLWSCLSFATATQNGGWFIAYNDTDKTVELTVGNIFPSHYIIGAHKSTFVSVSTDNQNIHIVNVR